MDTLEDVYLYVSGLLAPKKLTNKDDAYIDEFIMSLKDENINSKRLLICLGIDLKNYSKLFVTTNELHEFIVLLKKIILNTQTVSKPKSFPHGAFTDYMRFSISLKNISHADKKPAISTKSPERYARISSFYSYINYVVMNNNLINIDLPSNLNPNKIKKYYNDFLTKGTFSNIKINNINSSNGWVFMANYTELESELDGKLILSIIDRLGFYIENIRPNEPYICMKYPIGFSEVVYQPTALTGDWGNFTINPISQGNEFFLSYYINNTWGKTFSVSGTIEGANERIHIKFSDNTNPGYDFSVLDLGPINAILHRCTPDVIINEALKRYNLA